MAYIKIKLFWNIPRIRLPSTQFRTNPSSVNFSTNQTSTQAQVFPYKEYANEQILKKKEDSTYRHFIHMNRDDPVRATQYISNTKTVDLHGIGTGGSRLSTNSTFHDGLEQALAELHNKEMGLLFTSGYIANEAALTTLGKLLPGCEIFSDANNHASLIQGARMSKRKKHLFNRNDASHLEFLLSKTEMKTPKIVAFESVHSMDGNISQVGELCKISRKYGALTFLDEAHAIGLYGYNGAGIGEHYSLLDEIDVISGSLNKAHGAVGGYIAGCESIVDLIRCNAPGFIFTAALPPALVCAATEAIKILKSDEGRFLRSNLFRNVNYMREKLHEAQIPFIDTKSHLIPILVGNPTVCTYISEELLCAGHFLPAINYPTVPHGDERFRLMPSAFHTFDMMDDFVKNLLRIWNQANWAVRMKDLLNL